MTTVQQVVLNTQIWKEWNSLKPSDRETKWNTHAVISITSNQKDCIENPHKFYETKVVKLLQISLTPSNRIEFNQLAHTVHEIVQLLPRSFINQVKVNIHNTLSDIYIRSNPKTQYTI